MKNLKAHGEMVLLEFREIKLEGFTNKNGIIMPRSEKEQKKHEAIVIDVGEKVEMDKVQWKIGDKVVYNPHDLFQLGDEEKTFGLVQSRNIWATYTD